MSGWQSFGKETIKDKPSIFIKSFKDQGYFKDYGDIHSTINFIYNGIIKITIKFCIHIGKNDEFISLVFVNNDNNNINIRDNTTSLFILLNKTKCNYGGYRYWFICPNCKKRYSYLYLEKMTYFYCRKCLNLCYPEQKASKLYRNGLNFFKNKEDAENLCDTIKYKYRNGKKTRKYAKYCKLTNNYINCFI